MSLRAEQLMNNKQRHNSAQSEHKSSSPRHVVTPDSVQHTKQEVTLQQPRHHQEVKKVNCEVEEKKREKTKEVTWMEKKVDLIETRQEPEGQQADSTVVEHNRTEVSQSLYN